MPECFADTLLIQTLVPTERGYNHKHNCFKVEAEMKSGALKDKFAVGIIDKDKKQIGYLNDFLVIDELKGTLILWRHNDKQKHHYFIQICPALERWIMNVCESENIDLTIFGLKNELDVIRKETKPASSINNYKLKSLFAEINKKINNSSVSKLKAWIRLLKEKNYQIDINELKNA
jgi:hypothetical protein